MDNDDDRTVILTDADMEKLEKDIQSGKFDSDYDDDTTIDGLLRGFAHPIS